MVVIGNIRKARGDGLAFIASRRAAVYEVTISREALDDLIEGDTGGEEARMRDAFKAHQARIADATAMAIDAGRGNHPNRILLQTKDF